jgi:hypothetical protein
MSNQNSTNQRHLFDVELCRTGVGFSTIKVQAPSEYEAQQKALDIAGNFEYSEKNAEYTLCNPVLSAQEKARMDRPAMELILELSGAQTTRVGAAALACNAHFISHLAGLRELVEQNSLSEVRYHTSPASWMGDLQETGFTDTQIVVDKTCFSLVGHDDVGDCDFCSLNVRLDVLIEAFDSGANRFVVLQGMSRPDDLSFLEDAGIFDDERGIEGLVAMTHFEIVSHSDLQKAYTSYCGVTSQPRE